MSRIKIYFIIIGFETKVDGNAWGIALSLRSEFKKFFFKWIKWLELIKVQVHTKFGYYYWIEFLNLILNSNRNLIDGLTDIFFRKWCKEHESSIRFSPIVISLSMHLCNNVMTLKQFIKASWKPPWKKEKRRKRDPDHLQYSFKNCNCT